MTMPTPSVRSISSITSPTQPPRPVGASDIDYVDYSIGFWRGCPPISEACEHCYAHAALARWEPAQDWTIPQHTSVATWRHPIAKARDGSWKWPSGSRVFVCPQSDWFLDVPFDWRHEACEVIEQRPDLVWIFVTKRPPKMRIEDIRVAVLPKIPRASRWLLVTTENQKRLDERLPAIHAARPYFGVVGLSLSPLLGPINLNRVAFSPSSGTVIEGTLLGTSGRTFSPCGATGQRLVDWVVIEWESGAGARPTDPDWARSVIAQCRAAGVPVYVKQITRAVSGSRIPMDQWPEDLRIRELPAEVVA